MLYLLSAFSDVIGPLNVLRYITFRTGGAMITALVFVFLLVPAIIDHLRLRQERVSLSVWTDRNRTSSQKRAFPPWVD